MTRDLIRRGSREFTAVLHFTKTVRRLYHCSLCVKNFCCPHWEKFSEQVTQGVILLLGAITRHPWRCDAMLHFSIVILNTVAMTQDLLQILYIFPFEFYTVAILHHSGGGYPCHLPAGYRILNPVPLCIFHYLL